MQIFQSGLARRLAGVLDHFHGRHDAGFGAMNGQRERQRVVRALVENLDLIDAVETGTMRGTTTEFLAELVPGSVYTVEANLRPFTSSRLRFRKAPRVHTFHGDSREFLRRLAADGTRKPRTLFYLDAHWDDDLPLPEELKIIQAGPWVDPVVMIDDFEVPDDPGYGFDDYGPGKRIGIAILPQDGHDWTLLLPGMPATEETGARRGCGVLVPSKDVARTVRATTLRVAP
jgi:hypothetical protein